MTSLGFTTRSKFAHHERSLLQNLFETGVLGRIRHVNAVAEDGSEIDFGAVATGVALQNSSNGSKVVWFASLDAFTDGAYSSYGPGATYYYAIAASWENDAYTSSLGAIGALDMTEQPMNVSALAMLIWSIILILVIPLCFIIAGVVVWIIRRRR